MPSLALSLDNTSVANPLDLVEQVISANDWAFDRRSDSDMAAQAPGKWCDYGLYFCWLWKLGRGTYKNDICNSSFVVF